MDINTKLSTYRLAVDVSPADPHKLLSLLSVELETIHNTTYSLFGLVGCL